ncbi:hypothetical protein [Pseudoponticoccus marisrubri]|uniref:UrcA family protein n=1 Tax=Pseudoponticoccus marisrubri TaxID=1685382 RepID=A0A0W7WQ44_9RHOB|nr:hypothetical protein [Pseudoponticoccus marisrubri]KUF12641.1 hypothetical protein AVJ23_02680 [Pseudoponticoccus marisrubri]
MRPIIALLCLTALPAGAAAEGIYSLYRSSPGDPLASEHVATFDTRHGAETNAENCWLAARLFQERPEVETRYYCMPGRAKGSAPDTQ